MQKKNIAQQHEKATTDTDSQKSRETEETKTMSQRTDKKTETTQDTAQNDNSGHRSTATSASTSCKKTEMARQWPSDQRRSHDETKVRTGGSPAGPSQAALEDLLRQPGERDLDVRYETRTH